MRSVGLNLLEVIHFLSSVWCWQGHFLQHSSSPSEQLHRRNFRTPLIASLIFFINRISVHNYKQIKRFQMWIKNWLAYENIAQQSIYCRSSFTEMAIGWEVANRYRGPSNGHKGLYAGGSNLGVILEVMLVRQKVKHY